MGVRNYNAVTVRLCTKGTYTYGMINNVLLSKYASILTLRFLIPCPLVSLKVEIRRPCKLDTVLDPNRSNPLDTNTSKTLQCTLGPWEEVHDT